MKNLNKLKFIILIFPFFLQSYNGFSQIKEEKMSEAQSQNGIGNKPGAGMKKVQDPDLIAFQKKVLDKFVQLTFKDSMTSKKLDYNLYFPKDYNKKKAYPLVLFIADASTVGRGTEASLTQGYGGLVWASEASQSANPSFVLVPSYTSTTVNDKFETTEEVEMTVRLITSLVETYNIDQNRLYSTGQSMGGMMSMHFNILHPDLFAASVYVSCQWDVSKMQGFAGDKFFYIVAAGDEKATKGMSTLRSLLVEKNVKIASGQWSAKLDQSEQQANVQKLLSEKRSINFIVFTKGSVLRADGSGMEHMESFNYAYKLKGVRDWLFEQKKN